MKPALAIMSRMVNMTTSWSVDSTPSPSLLNRNTCTRINFGTGSDRRTNGRASRPQRGGKEEGEGAWFSVKGFDSTFSPSLLNRNTCEAVPRRVRI